MCTYIPHEETLFYGYPFTFFGVTCGIHRKPVTFQVPPKQSYNGLLISGNISPTGVN